MHCEYRAAIVGLPNFALLAVSCLVNRFQLASRPSKASDPDHSVVDPAWPLAIPGLSNALHPRELLRWYPRPPLAIATAFGSRVAVLLSAHIYG